MISQRTSLVTLWSPLVVVLAGLSAPGCAADDPIRDAEEVATDVEALELEVVVLSDVQLELDGVPAGLASAVTVDVDGQVEITFIAGEASVLFERVLHEMTGSDAGVVGLRAIGRDTSKGVREIEMTGCLMKEVSFSQLKADDGKSLPEVSAKFQPQNLKYVAGGGAIGVAPSRVISSTVEVPGLPSADVTGLTITARRPTPSYAAWSVDGLKISGSAHGGYEAAKALVESGVVVDISLSLTDETTGDITTVLVSGTAEGVAPVSKGGIDKPLQWTLELSCEGQTIHIAHKA